MIELLVGLFAIALVFFIVPFGFGKLAGLFFDDDPYDTWDWADTHIHGLMTIMGLLLLYFGLWGAYELGSALLAGEVL